MKNNKVIVLSVILILMLAAAGLTYKSVLARPYSAATAPGLGAADGYSVIGKAGVTNVGSSVLSGTVGADGSIGVGIISAGEILAPAVDQAEIDARAAFLNLSSQGQTASIGVLDGLTLVPGVYDMGAGSLGGGTLTLNGEGVYIFRTASNLVSAGSVSLIGGARGCDVFWYVASDAAINGASFVGTIIAETSITFGDSVQLDGRALALTGNVTLQNNTISGPSCPSSAAAPSTGGGLPDNPQPESGSTEAYVGTQTALTATAISSRAGVPSTGGAPLRSDGTIWFILGFSGLSVAILFYITRKINRNNGPK